MISDYLLPELAMNNVVMIVRLPISKLDEKKKLQLGKEGAPKSANLLVYLTFLRSCGASKRRSRVAASYHLVAQLGPR